MKYPILEHVPDLFFIKKISEREYKTYVNYEWRASSREIIFNKHSNVKYPRTFTAHESYYQVKRYFLKRYIEGFNQYLSRGAVVKFGPKTKKPTW